MVVAVARDLCVTRVTSEAGGYGQGPRARDSGRGGTGPSGVGTGVRAAAVPSGAAPGGRAAWGRKGTGDGRGSGRDREIGRLRPAPGVPGTDRPFCVTGLLSPAVRSQSAGARSHDVPEVRHTPQRSHAWFLTGPPLAGTDTRTNEAGPEPVTRRTGESGPELRCGRPLTRGAPGRTRGALAREPGGTQMRPRHSSSIVMASAVPGLPSASRKWPRTSISRARFTRRPPEEIRAS